MEMTKKEYITKLKKELDTIEQRYQHLLNENCMIGEDFRSKAADNLHFARGLEQRIDGLEATIKDLNKTIDDKDLELVIQGRQCETFQMQCEETLTYYSLMRDKHEHYKNVAEVQTSLAEENANTIEQIKQEHAEKERNRLEALNEMGT